MPRYLVCLDEPAPANGVCAHEAWIEQPTWASYLPTVQQAVEIGVTFWGSLIVLAAAKRLLKPQRHL